ncbi:MAG: hypothetical protein AAF745_04195 [Planctomycetota bacterium]
MSTATPIDPAPEPSAFQHLKSAAPRETYRLSGRVNTGRTVVWLLLAGIVCVATAAVYCIASVKCPEIKLTALVTFLAGGVISGWVYLVCRQGHVRNQRIACVIAGGLGVFTLYFAWVAHLNYWAYELNANGGNSSVFMATPVMLYEWASWLFVNGSWTIGDNGNAVTGWVLVGFWVAEAAILIGFPIAVVIQQMKSWMYCEECQQWMQYDQESVNLPTRSTDLAISRLRKGDLASIIQLGVDELQRERISMKLCVCKSCEDSGCVEITETVREVANGQTVDREKRIAGPLAINRDEESELRELAQQLKMVSAEMVAARLEDSPIPTGEEPQNA